MDAYAPRPMTQDAAATVRPYYRMSNLLALAMTASTIGFVALSMHLPVGLLADASFDDAIFVKHAASIVAGHWLGTYGDLTLAKGPGYPLFLAFNAILGLPVTLTQALLYSGACALLAVTVFRIFGSAWVGLLGFLLMQWHPSLFPVRIIRDDLSAAQVLLVLACLCHVVFLPTRLRNRLSWAAVGGVCLAWFWMTREDALWVLPGFAVICLLQGLRLLPAWREVRRLAATVAVFGVAALGTLAMVATINLKIYGTFTIVDFKNPQFTRTLDILQSVRVGEPVPYVPVPTKVRQQLDIVSPAFASLEPYLHGPGKFWMQPGCAVYPATCHDFAGGWFMWALRDAVASQGGYRTPQTAAGFYRLLWAQVHDACKSGRLQCRKNVLPFMPAMRPDQWDLLPAELERMYGLATSQLGQANWLVYERALLRSTGGSTQVQAMSSFLGNPLAAPAPDQVVSSTVTGWFWGPSGEWLRVRCSGVQGTVILPVLRQPSADLMKIFHNAADQRFDVTLPSIMGCGFEPVPALPYEDFLSFGNIDVGITDYAGGRLSIDSLSPGTPGSRGQMSLGTLRRLGHFYGRIIPAATVLSLIVYAVSLVRALLRDRRRRFDAQLIILTGIGTLLLGRAAILVLVDISSFPAITQSYWGAGFPLLSLMIVLAVTRPFLNARGVVSRVARAMPLLAKTVGRR